MERPSPSHLRGLALMPVKFGISFTRRTLNQASALVNIYTDGTIQVSTGGTEMGQGLYTKIGQLVADEFALPLESVRVMPTSTEKNNNTSPTAASASTDLNGTAALRACEVLKQRLAETAAPASWLGEPAVPTLASEIVFERRQSIRRPQARNAGLISRAGAAGLRRARRPRARGFYATPGIDFDRETGRGTPFLYYTNGRGRFRGVDRSFDRRAFGHAGRHPARPRPVAQSGDRPRPGDRRVRPGDGLGDDRGAALFRKAASCCRTRRTNTRSRRSTASRPIFACNFLEDSDNPINLLGSKAVGEPPFVLGLSVWAAAKQALSSLHAGRPGGSARCRRRAKRF